LILGSREDRKTISIEPEGDPRKSSVSDDNRYMAVCGWEHGGAEVWSAQSGNRLAKLNCGRHGVPLFSPDGKYLVTSPDGVTVWRTGDWKEIRGLNAVGTTPTGLGIAFSSDSRALAVSDASGAISLLDPETGTEWAKLSDRLMSIATIMAFSRDQRWLITSSFNENVPAQVWDLAAMRDALKAHNLDWPAEVLHAGASESYVEGPIEVAVDDDGRFKKKPE
jgi:WD40 repeat protein